MKQKQIQKITLDSCVVIDLIEKPRVASGLKARLRGKSLSVVLCDVVLQKVQRVGGLSPKIIIEKISKIKQRIFSVEITTIGKME